MTHDDLDLSPPGRRVAMYWALGALRFAGAEGAVIEARQGIPLKFGAIHAQCVVRVMQIPAADTNHCLQGFLFALKP